MPNLTWQDIESYNQMLQDEELYGDCYPPGYWETLWERCQ